MEATLRPSTLANGVCRGDEGLNFDTVCVDVGANRKRVLWNVSGRSPPGQVLAVMGASGSGKTTLLNAIAGYLPLSSGLVTINGRKTGNSTKRIISYVLQQDIFYPNLTLRETLRYSALLRLPAKLTFRHKLDKVEHVIRTLQLEDCANTIIGDPITRGLSGGETKRASIGCELLTDPTLLLLDEPTTGLDSFSALSLLKTIKSLAEDHHKTVVMSVHQPSSQMYHMFGGLLMLAKGKVAYFGEADQAIHHFSQLGLKACSPDYNPADYMLDMLTNAESRKVLIGEDPQQSDAGPKRSKWRRLLQCCGKGRNSDDHTLEVVHYPDSPQFPGQRKFPPLPENASEKEKEEEEERKREEMEAEKEKSEHSATLDRSEPKWATPWHHQFLVLIARTFRQSRHHLLSKMNVTFSLAVVVMCCLVWFQIPQDEDSIITRFGLIFFSAVFWMTVPLIWALQSFPRERAVVGKDRARGSYHLSAFYLAKVVSEAPLLLVLPTIYHIVVYWCAGMNSAPASFFASWFVYLLGSFVGQSAGFAVGATVVQLKTAIVMAVTLILIFMLLGGYIIQNLPFWLSWAKVISFFTYCYEAQLQLEFTADQQFSCDLDASAYAACENMTVSSTNATLSGSDVLRSLDLIVPFYANVLILLGIFLVMHTYSYFALRFLNRK